MSAWLRVVSETPARIATRRRPMRLRKSNFPKPSQNSMQRKVAIIRPALRTHESAVAFLNAQHPVPGRPFDLATEPETGRLSAAEVVHAGPGRGPGET